MKVLPEFEGFSRRCGENISVCFSRFTVSTAIYLQNANAKFHKVVCFCRDIIHVRWKTFTLLHGKLTQDKTPNFIKIG